MQSSARLFSLVALISVFSAQFLSNEWGILAQILLALLLSAAALLFTASLLPSQIPLITRIAYLMEDHTLSPRKQVYTLRLTQFWSLALLVMAFLKWHSVWMSLEGTSKPLWILGVYLLFLLIFPLEYTLRSRLFEEHREESFFSFLRKMGQVSFQDVWQLRSLHSEPLSKGADLSRKGTNP